MNETDGERKKDILPDLNHLLDDDDDEASAGNQLHRGAKGKMKTKIGPDGQVIYILDDDEDEDGIGVDDELRQRVLTGGKNAELEMRQAELAKFLQGEVQNQ